MARTRVSIADLVADPHGTLGRARAAGWIVETEQSEAVVRYAEMRALLGDARLRESYADFMQSLGVVEGPFYEWMSRSPLNLDGEAHAQWRAVLSRTFTPRRVEGIRPFLGRAAHELIDRFADRGECDFVAAFADVYPSLGLCELIGVPHEDRDRFRGWADTIGLGFSPVELPLRIREVDEALQRLLEYASDLASRRRTEPRDDLVTQITRAADEAGWDAEQVRGSIAGLVFAGHETTKNQLGWMVATLAEHPDTWDGAAAGAPSIPAVVEEVLRFSSAVAGVGRVATAPIEQGGLVIDEGTPLFLSVWSANRDETAFPAADRFDVARNGGSPHLAFGHGAHFCLGAALARAELQEALAALVARVECPRLVEGAAWRLPIGINGPTRLPIEFRQRARKGVTG